MAIEELEEQEEVEVEKKAGLSTLKIVALAVTLTVVLGGGLVGATFYFVSSMNSTQVVSADSDGNVAENKDEGDDEAEDEDKEDDEAEDEDKEDGETLPPKYFSMDPKFIVSFNQQRSARFMQFSIDVMTRDAETIKQLEAHMPVIRSSLLMLFGSQGYEEMITRKGKEKLLMDVTADINLTLQKVLDEKEPITAIEAAYFNTFVIQ